MKMILMILCFPVLAQASGKLQVMPVYNPQTKQAVPVVGLSVYEPLSKVVAYNSWTGYGESNHSFDGGDWVVTKHDLEFYVWRFTLGAGVGAEYFLPTKAFNPMVRGKIHVKLW